MIAVFICGVPANVRREPGFYSIIAAVVCVLNSAGKTIEPSINRRISTLTGGVAGVLLAYGMDALGILYVELARYATSALLLISIIELCPAIKKPDSAAMACIVSPCVTVNHSMENTPTIYSIQRLFETLLGVALVCGVDILLPCRAPAAEGTFPTEDIPAQDAPRRGRTPAGRLDGQAVTYRDIHRAVFRSRPNRFIAWAGGACSG